VEEVYLARDSRLERDIAIKVLPAHLSSGAITCGGDSTARSNSKAPREDQFGAGNGDRTRDIHLGKEVLCFGMLRDACG
jgi:hypothetical protein